MRRWGRGCGRRAVDAHGAAVLYCAYRETALLSGAEERREALDPLLSAHGLAFGDQGAIGTTSLLARAFITQRTFLLVLAAC